MNNKNDTEMNIKLDMKSYPQFKRVWHEEGYSDQEVRDKIGKNNGWSVCRSWTDVNNKKMYFEILINADKTEIREVEYKNICRAYGWKSFTWSDDKMMIFPQK